MAQLEQLFLGKTTPEIARNLLGTYLAYQGENGKIGGYIVDVEAYLGPVDQAAHSFGMKRTTRVTAMYQNFGTIYLYTMHTHLILNIVTQNQDVPEGVMIRAIEPGENYKQMLRNRGNQTGWNLTNGPGKLVQALGLTKDLYGQSIFDSALTIKMTRRKKPQIIQASPRIGIPNKGIWTRKLLRYTVKGNPYCTNQKLKDIDQLSWGWRK